MPTSSKSIALAVAVLAWGYRDARAESDLTAHAHHPVHAAAFVGMVSSAHGTGPAAGVDLERRFGPIGMAVVFDTARVAEATVVTVIPAVVIHPWRGSKVIAGVGWERAHGEDELVMRGGAGYDVHIGSMSFGPTMAVDRVSQTTVLVVGATVGAGF